MLTKSNEPLTKGLSQAGRDNLTWAFYRYQSSAIGLTV